MDFLIDVERLGNSDPEVAERAFVRLRGRLERYLDRYLRNWLSNPSDREEVSLSTLEKVWFNRLSFEVRSEGEWWGYLSLIARRCAFDRLDRTIDVSFDEGMSVEDGQSVETICQMNRERNGLYRAADELWLRRPRDMEDAPYHLRIGVAQMVYLDQRPWKDVAKFFQLDPDDRKTVLGWLLEKETFLGMVFRELHMDGIELANTVLAAVPAELWTSAESEVAVWRCRNGLLTEKIAQMAPHLTRQQIEAVLKRVCEAFPFPGRAEAIKKLFVDKKAEEYLALLTQPDSWKRIAFQYYAQSELPHRQILQRTKTAGEILGYQMNEGILNAWLSNGRIFVQLTNYVRNRRTA